MKKKDKLQHKIAKVVFIITEKLNVFTFLLKDFQAILNYFFQVALDPEIRELAHLYFHIGLTLIRYIINNPYSTEHCSNIAAIFNAVGGVKHKL